MHPDQALEKILECVTELHSEMLPLPGCLGYTLAQDVTALEDLPPFDSSAMDGYAVRTQDLKLASSDNPVSLFLIRKMTAGSAPGDKIRENEAIKIMTGAPLPEGADAVVIKEASVIDGNYSVRIFHAPSPGEFIRRRAEDVRSGQVLLTRGTRIRHYEIALLAAQGFTRVPVFQRPRVALLTTGDELMDNAHALPPGKIRNANGPAISAVLSRWGIPVIDKGIIGDNPGAIRKTLQDASDAADAILISGGVSVGEHDFTRTAMNHCGFKEVFWQVAIKPGRPLLLGTTGPSVTGERKLLFGLPGNPLSALVCLEEFVRPALEKMQGITREIPPYHLVGKALNAYPRSPDRQHYLFCRAAAGRSGFKIDIIQPQSSAMMGAACRANAIALSPLGLKKIEKDDQLLFRWLE